MDSRRTIPSYRWLLVFAALAAIIAVYRIWVHVNPTTVALTLLLFILLVASRWSIRYAIAASVAATIGYNFYFLPPVGTFTVVDPQNWLALLAFLATSVIGSRMSQRTRNEAEQAKSRQREVEVLFRLGRELLQAENVATLAQTIPRLIEESARADSVSLYLLDGDRLQQAGSAQSAGEGAPDYRQLALQLQRPETLAGEQTRIPLRAGVRPRGLLLLGGVRLSQESFEAIGGLVSIALDRAQALEDVARSEANKESERLRTLILDSITHELRTPLTSIKGAASTLLSVEGMREEDRRELLSIVEEEADHLNRLVAQAVEMAQLEARKVRMHFLPVAMADIVAQARESCAWVGNTHPVSIRLPALPNVLADAGMVGKVMCNLIENAAKYSKPGAPISISAEQKDGLVLTSVADRGPGIHPAEQELIFERLYRSRAHSGTTSGTGMGLAISRAIMELHRGSLTVWSRPEHGSVFTLALPVEEEQRG